METSLHSTIVGVFGDRGAAEQTVQALEDAGFEHDQIWYSSPGGAGRFFEDIKSLFTGSSTTDENLVNQLSTMGLSDEEARAYADAYNSGHAVVAVRAPGREQEIWDLFHAHGASSYNASTNSFTSSTVYDASTDSSPSATPTDSSEEQPPAYAQYDGDTTASSTETEPANGTMDSTEQSPAYAQYGEDTTAPSAETASANDPAETESAQPTSQEPVYISPSEQDSFAAIYTSGQSPEGRYPQEDTMISPSETTTDQYSSQGNQSGETNAASTDYASLSTPEAMNGTAPSSGEMETSMPATSAALSPAEAAETAEPYEPTATADYTTPPTMETQPAQPTSATSTPANYEARMQDLQRQIQETQRQLEEARARLQAAREHEGRFKDAQKQLQDLRDQLSATLDELRQTEENIARFG